jgi:hypothetical protein
MPQVTESTMVGGPVSEVWALLRDFGAIGDWHPALPPAEIENGPADRVGCVRVFPLAGGHRETLTGLDDQQRRITFTFADHAAGLSWLESARTAIRHCIVPAVTRPVWGRRQTAELDGSSRIGPPASTRKPPGSRHSEPQSPS